MQAAAAASTPTAGLQSDANKAPQPAAATREGVRVMTSIEFLQGAAKVFESKLVVTNEVTEPDRKAVVFQMDVPLQALKQGLYLCQVNVVDDLVGSFSFPRFPLLIREPATKSPPQAAAASTSK